MSGSSRSAARSARLNDPVWVYTSRWLTRHFLFSWTNSIGSSIVMMWSLRVSLMRSTMAARVVDFPDPVGPVTSTRPLFSKHRLRTHSGRPRSSKLRISAGIWRKTAPTPWRSRKRLTRNLATPGISYAKSVSLSARNSVRLAAAAISSHIRRTCSDDSGVVNSGMAAMSPWRRISGGRDAVRCRSEPPISTRRRSIRSRGRSSAGETAGATATGGGGAVGATGAGSTGASSMVARGSPPERPARSVR